MDPVNPWLDPAAVRHLAEQLLRPVAPAHPSAADLGFDDSFIGFISAEVATPALEPPSSAPFSAPLPTLSVPPPPQAIQPAISAPSRTQFLQRLDIFRDWLAKHYQATDIFLLDREGKSIFDESDHGRFHFMARNLASSTRATENVHIKIGPAAILELIPCETPFGHIILGAMVADALPAAQIDTITKFLIQTASLT